jgi:hypothetical protein
MHHEETGSQRAERTDNGASRGGAEARRTDLRWDPGEAGNVNRQNDMFS